MPILKMLSLAIMALAVTTSTTAQVVAPLSEPVADRSDAARSYMAFEQAFADHAPDDVQRRQFVNRQIDWLARLIFTNQWQRAVEEFDGMTRMLLPPGDITTSAMAARATQVRAMPPVAVRGHDPTIQLTLRPMYDIANRPVMLTVRIRNGEQILLERPFSTEGDLVTWQPGPDPQAARYAIEILDETGHFETRGVVTLLDRRPSELRADLAERLDALEETLPADRADLQRSLLAARSRLTLLRNLPEPSQAASFLADLAQLSHELPYEVAELEAGRNPYTLRPGDYWRHFNTIIGPAMSLPARVYAPASALEAIAAGERVPLVIALHGAGGDENLFMDGYGAGVIKRLADQHGFILVSPLTYTAMTDARALTEIIESIAALYAIDDGRVYAVGHSLGAITAASWAWNYADKLAGVALIAGGGQPAAPGNVSPTYVAAAEFDRMFAASRLESLAITAAQRGALVEYRLFEGESHVSIVPEALPPAIEWLLRHRRAAE